MTQDRFAETTQAGSGDLKILAEVGQAVSLEVTERDREAFRREVPAEEWGWEVRPDSLGLMRLTALVPRSNPHAAGSIRRFRPAPERDRSALNRHDWRDDAPSPNPGLLGYHVAPGLMAVTLPLMVKPGVRHDFYRRFFLELTGDPENPHTLRYHNDPGITIEEERKLVERLRQSVGR